MKLLQREKSSIQLLDTGDLYNLDRTNDGLIFHHCFVEESIFSLFKPASNRVFYFNFKSIFLPTLSS